MVVVTSILKYVRSRGEEETSVTYRLFMRTPFSCTVQQSQEQTVYMMKLENFARRMVGYARLCKNLLKINFYTAGFNQSTNPYLGRYFNVLHEIEGLMIPHLKGGKLPVRALRAAGQKFFELLKANDLDDYSPEMKSNGAFYDLQNVCRSFVNKKVKESISVAWAHDREDEDNIKGGIGDEFNRWRMEMCYPAID